MTDMDVELFEDYVHPDLFAIYEDEAGLYAFDAEGNRIPARHWSVEHGISPAEDWATAQAVEESIYAMPGGVTTPDGWHTTVSPPDAATAVWLASWLVWIPAAVWVAVSAHELMPLWVVGWIVWTLVCDSFTEHCPKVGRWGKR